MSKLIHQELSYAIRGILFDVYNVIGPSLKEEYYQDAVLIGARERGIVCEAEKEFEVFYESERVGLYFVDVWIENGKILLEIKVDSTIEALHKAQAISYLKVTDADLAFVTNFGSSSLQIERLPNYLRDKHPEFSWSSKQVAKGLLYPEIVNEVQRACHRVHFTLGPGFLHQIYRRATMIELRRSSVSYEYIKQVPLEYNNHILGFQDARVILIEGRVLLTTLALRQAEVGTRLQEFKALLRRLNLKLGLLANFHDTRLVISPIRIK